MIKQTISLFILLSLIACARSKPKIESIEDEHLTNAQIDSILNEFNFHYSSPIVIDSADQILIPISTQQIEKKSFKSRSGYYANSYPRFWNILFYNLKEGESRLLTEGKIRISQFYVNERQEYEGSNRLMKNKILYQLADLDYNEDGTLDEMDPEFLFISEIDGSNLKRVSPSTEDLQYFEVIPRTNQILIKTLRDNTNDSIFNNDDESIWYIANLLNQEWTLKEIIDSTGRKRIENMYFEQWLRKP